MAKNKPNKLSWLDRNARTLFLAAVVLLGVAALGWAFWEKGRLKHELTQIHDRQMTELIEEAKKDTGNPCSTHIMQIVEQIPPSSIETTVVFAGEVVMPGTEHLYTVQGDPTGKDARAVKISTSNSYLRKQWDTRLQCIVDRADR